MCKSMFGPEVIRRVELCFFRPCAKLTSLQDREPRTSETHHVVIPADKLFWRQRTLNFYLYKPCVMCLILLLSRLLQSGSEPGLPLSLWARACASLWPAGTWVSPTSLLLLFNKYTYMQLRSPEVTWVRKSAAISVTVIKKPYLTSKNIEYTVTFTTWLSMYYLLSVNNDTRTCLSDGTDMFIDINIYFGNMNWDIWATYRLLQVIYCVVLFYELFREMHIILWKC